MLVIYLQNAKKLKMSQENIEKHKEFLRKRAIRYLEKYSVTRQKFTDYLCQKYKKSFEIEPNSEVFHYIQSLADQFENLDLINDISYAERKIINLRQKGYSKSYIQNYLRQKGVSSETISECLSNDSNEEVNALEKFIQKKRLDVNNQKDLQKIARAGFSYSTISKLKTIDM